MPWEKMASWGLGSSPRVRGKPAVSAGAQGGGGLIPARAGKTAEEFQGHSVLPAHPRACGENQRRHVGRGPGAGSSPRVRGKPASSRGARPRRGLIPARAGKTPPRLGGGAGVRAHPRACGENR